MASPSSKQNLLDQYSKFLVNHVHQVSDIEAALKWLSYFVAGRAPNSSFMTELVYATSNVIRFANDQLLDQMLRPKGTRLRMAGRQSSYRIKQILSVINCVEIFVEVSADKFAGSKGRMLVIVLLQAIKATLNLILLMCHRISVIRRVPISTLDRNEFKKDCSQALVLKRTQRMMRALRSSSSMATRSWRPPCYNLSAANLSEEPSSVRLTAELLNISRPLLHLAAMAKFGKTSWIPWSLSAAVDVTSLCLHRHADSALTPSEEQELNTREMELLFYLLRSPLYDQYTRKKLFSLFAAMSKVPVVNWVTNSLSSYLDERLQIYFYTWS